MSTERDLEYTLVPSYGRDYATAEAVLADWSAGKDFRIETAASRWYGAQTSVRDLKCFPGKHVKIRYRKLSRFVLVEIATGLAQRDLDELIETGGDLT